MASLDKGSFFLDAAPAMMSSEKCLRNRQTFSAQSAGEVSGIQADKQKSMGDPSQTLPPKLPVTLIRYRSLASVVEQSRTPQICMFLPPDSFTTHKLTYINLLRKSAGVC